VIQILFAQSYHMVLLQGQVIDHNAALCSLRYNTHSDKIGNVKLTGGHWFDL